MHVIIEGSRGMGKTVISRELRKRNMGVVLTNHTGLNGDSESVKDEMYKYYDSYINFMLSSNGLDFIHIHDRFIQSEYAMSMLYKKNYTFEDSYTELMQKLDGSAVDVLVIYFVNRNKEEILRNLGGDTRQGKAHLFEDSSIQDDYNTVSNQTIAYEKVYQQDLKNNYKNIKVLQYNLEGKSIEEVINGVQELITQHNH